MNGTGDLAAGSTGSRRRPDRPSSATLMEAMARVSGVGTASEGEGEGEGESESEQERASASAREGGGGRAAVEAQEAGSACGGG